MQPIIRLYLDERPNIDAIRLHDAVLLEMSPNDAPNGLFPDKRQGFDHYHVRDDLYLKLFVQLTVATQPDIERTDANDHLEDGRLEAQLSDIGIPEWFEQKLTRRDGGIIKLDTIAYERFMRSNPQEQQSINALAELSGLQGYAEILKRTKGQATYIAEASMATNNPNINAYNALARLTNSMLRYGGFITVKDDRHASYTGEQFHQEAHYDKHREHYELVTNRKQLHKMMRRNRN